jgi:cell division protein ZapA
MPQVTVTIAGKTYRMACGAGEEAHLEALAQGFDERVGEMRKAFGEIGDMRLHVMAALTLADELAETKRRMEAMERETAALRETTDAGTAEREGAEARLAETVQRTAERIERLAKRLGPVPGGAQGG